MFGPNIFRTIAALLVIVLFGKYLRDIRIKLKYSLARNWILKGCVQMFGVSLIPNMLTGVNMCILTNGWCQTGRQLLTIQLDTLITYLDFRFVPK